METGRASRCYLALSGDLRKSRHLRDRAAVQERLETALHQANRRFTGSLAVPLGVVQGDAFQALIAEPAVTIALLVALEQDLQPARFRVGLGWGPLTTPLRASTASMDGPAFHLASAALESARTDDAWLAIRGVAPADAEAVDGVAALLGAVRFAWSVAQSRAVAARRLHSTSKAAAESAGVSPSAISRALKAAHYPAVLRAEAVLAGLLQAAVTRSPCS
ncbi:MAG TPA: SatD family protein [Candidatus Krumholzibacteria bacterium]|nr:SatD family protein [Candidatus Krumholzibacteria bacterium]HPD72579.1 SatD family protein [Candidatus Krumholzibacteria bacterium]HRY40489.1 SatD family protein [Candidatus Krumholzibacteria bacterium]